MLTGYDGLYSVAVTALGNASDALAVNTTAGRPQRVCLYPGAIVMDQCDCGGMLAGTIERDFPSDTFPIALATAWICEPAYLVADFGLLIARCAPMVDSEGKPPTCTELDAAALVQATDARVINQSVTCTLADMLSADDISHYLVRGRENVGPTGDCVGSLVRFTVGIGY